MAFRHLAPTNSMGKLALQRLNSYDLLIRSTTGISISSLVCTRKPRKFLERNILIGMVGINFDGGGGRRREATVAGAAREETEERKRENIC
ncbi:hypothetical protein F511_44887 [Dorcoceras hygrometricum]|uniref:Uncharacterized protein n=1 Tax=Dorcoceras hygrometricum TaxID=472368 RepID=A0A2Z7B1L2_9LAMI|nr:hypothetical protein F511_44887 [Dorcoceras hygrometricum]